jgi:hypothetical protein
MTPFGPLIAPPGQYTHCVDRTAYRPFPKSVLKASAAAIAEFILCDYLLGGKLVCLAGGQDECAIGMVVGVEGVGTKTGFDAIDNDFSFNVLLVPYKPNDFRTYLPPHPAKPTDPPPDTSEFEPHKIYTDVVAHGPLGRLMKDPTPTPVSLPDPLDQTGGVGKSAMDRGTATWPLDGYGVVYTWKGPDLAQLQDADHKEGSNLRNLSEGGSSERIALPVMHCECEGSRIFFVCQALKPFLEIMQGKVPGSGLPGPGEVCHATLGWIPFGIGDAICSIAEDLIALPIALALAPAMAAAFATAWEAAQAYDDLFVTGPVAKQIHVGDVVIVTGRWTWDAGHSGHTELHAVKTIQKLMHAPGELPPELRPPTVPVATYNPQIALHPPAVVSEILATHDRWCHLVSEAPPPPDPQQPGGLSGAQLGSMSPEQVAVYTRQRQPENAWVIHPLIDGCAPTPPPEPLR